MVRALVALCLIASAVTAQQPKEVRDKLPAEAATLGEALSFLQQQSGLILTTTLDPKQQHKFVSYGSLWQLLDGIAEKCGGRLRVTNKGRTAVIDKDPFASEWDRPRPQASIDGAFRVVPKQVVCRRDLETGRSVTEVTLQVNWEPKLPVFRIHSVPRGVSTPGFGAFGGRAPVPFRDSNTSPGKSAVSGAEFTTVVRLDTAPRAADKLTLTGQFTVTAAAKMLQFRVADTSKPTTLTQEGVTFTLQTPRKIGDRWDVPVELAYPPSKVEFESFEAGVWLSRNRLQLIDPAGKPHEPINEDFRESQGKANLVYRFPATKLPADRAGWSLLYETPSPLVEFDIAFKLDIPLP